MFSNNVNMKKCQSWHPGVHWNFDFLNIVHVLCPPLSAVRVCLCVSEAHSLTCCSQEVSRRAPLLTCDLRDALQGGHWEGEDDALAGPHPQQALTDQQAGDTNLTWNTDTVNHQHEHYYCW